ncbi:hypothetical protein B5807_11338 [Epicoccum nigrum]|uniref:N-acetyltransferase domain-containing protein n=1 Tax=Epicoccum nigrum TaxID=105696 RepID=A0A1Y2LK98_EPING|nr:hypothetical protein B5807_11338 [Epicoccum nigrum]
MTSTARLSAPIYYTQAYLQTNPCLTTQITSLVNDAFARSKKADPQKWGENPEIRFPDNDSYFSMLGDEGIVAMIFDENTKDRKVVAVAGAIPWQGGWKKEGAGFEEGWEIKAVAVDGDARYFRQGLAVQLYSFLEKVLISMSKKLGVSTTGRPFNQEDQLPFWILAAECINGAYWRRRGYEFVRKDVYEAPTWGVLTSVEIVALRKVLPFEYSESELRVNSANRIDATASYDVGMP